MGSSYRLHWFVASVNEAIKLHTRVHVYMYVSGLFIAFHLLMRDNTFLVCYPGNKIHVFIFRNYTSLYKNRVGISINSTYATGYVR